MANEQLTDRQKELLAAIRVLMLTDATPTLQAIADAVGAPTPRTVYNSIVAMRNANLIGPDNRLANDGPGKLVLDLATWLRETPSARIPAELRSRIERLTEGAE